MLTFHNISDIYICYGISARFGFFFFFLLNCTFPAAILIILANETALKQKLWNKEYRASTSSNEPRKKRLAKILTASVRFFLPMIVA